MNRSSVLLLLVDAGLRKTVSLSDIGDVLLPLPREIAEMHPALALRCAVRTFPNKVVSLYFFSLSLSLSLSL